MTGHELDYPDLAYAIDKGGDDLDGPVTLNNEPTGYAMRCTPPLETKCPRCGARRWVRVSLNQGYTFRRQCVPCGAIEPLKEQA